MNFLACIQQQIQPEGVNIQYFPALWNDNLAQDGTTEHKKEFSYLKEA